MKSYSTEKIRNLTLVGHSASLKTYLCEDLLYKIGNLKRLGKVDNGNTVTDFDKEEISRGFSISTAVVPVEWKDFKINLICTPRYFDCEEVYRSLRASEVCLFVLDDLKQLRNYESIKIYFDFLDVPRDDVYYLTEKEKIKIAKNVFDTMFSYDFTLPKIDVSGGNCMYKNHSSLTINSDRKVYKGCSLVNNKNFEMGYFDKNLNFDGVGSMCRNLNCNVYDFCLGGCPFSRYITDGNIY